MLCESKTEQSCQLAEGEFPPRAISGKNYDFEEIKQQLLRGPRVTNLAPVFERIASGLTQRPRKEIYAAPEFLKQNQELADYHDILKRNFGTFLKHGCASIPFLLEELVRIGVAVNKLAKTTETSNKPFSFYETSSADGTAARTLAEYAAGRIYTLTDSPNEANEIEFKRLCSHSYSQFYKGCFADITPSLIKQRYGHFSGGFDVIWENTTFQMYGNFRDEQIAYVKRLLKPKGVMIFLEKMNHRDQAEYLRRESIKDTNFKSLYFSNEEISKKKSDIIETMERGQTTIESFTRVAYRHFEHVHLIWNSLNFYHIAASNDVDSIEKFLSFLENPHVPEQFATTELGELVPTIPL